MGRPRGAVAAPWRAGAEGAVLAASLVGLLVLVAPIVPSEAFWASSVLAASYIGALAAVAVATRLVRPVGGGWRGVGWEAGMAIAAVAGIALVTSLTVWLALALRPVVLDAVGAGWFTGDREQFRFMISIALGVMTGIGFLFIYLVARPLARLWPSWNRMRRTRLVWALTHGQLVAGLILALVVALVMFSAILLIDPALFGAAGEVTGDDVIGRLLVIALPALTAIVLIGVVVVLLIVPAAALISYRVLRSTTARLEDLTTAAGALSGGDLSARVAVGGEDEVGQLQADFNAMARDLERSVGELEAERDIVARLLDMRGQLVTAVSHELRTPVATLRAHIEAALEHWSDTPPASLRADLAVMDGEVVRLGRLIDDLFDLVRAEQAQLPLRLAPTDVGDVLARVVDAVRPLAARSGRVELLLDVSPSLPRAVADPERLDQVVRNLALNAVRHTAPGGIVRLSAGTANDMPNGRNDLAIAVEDTGAGIAPVDLPRIWEPFFRTDAGRDRDRGGAGLGLALVKELVEAMDGSVSVSSVVGSGSRFEVRLPSA